MDLACLILSKNRPMNFDGCVRSIEQNFPYIKKFYFYIGNNKSDNISENYSNIINQMQKDCEVYWQILNEDFYEDLNTIFSDIKEEFVLLMTDDTFFYVNLFSEHYLRRKLEYFNNDDIFTLSLRLGENTVIQDPKIGSPMKVPEVTSWDWTKEPSDSNPGYPISMDGHIYRTTDIKKLTREAKFQNLRQWEGELSGNIRANPTKKLMCRLHSSICVNIPMSTVLGPCYNSGHPQCISNEKLIEMYKEGWRIDLDETFKNVEIVGSHQFIELKFIKL